VVSFNDEGKPEYSVKKHWTATSHWQTLPPNVVPCIPRHERDCVDRHWLHR